jgi:hypothetical protein
MKRIPGNGERFESEYELVQTLCVGFANGYELHIFREVERFGQYRNAPIKVDWEKEITSPVEIEFLYR